MNEPDFSVKKLSEYPVSDLEVLNEATRTMMELGKEFMKNDPLTPDISKCLDVWLYRIRDAIKEAKTKD